MSSPFAADKLIAQARQLAAEYRRTMGRPLPGVSNEIAEHDAIRLLELEPRNKAEGEAGWDAVDPRRGTRIQIKSRTIFDDSKGGERLGQLKMNQEWDAVVLVLMGADYEAYEIHQADREDLEAYVNQSSSSRARRGALSVARFKRIGRLRWDSERGLDPEILDNQAGP